jgi:putative inorganic carbon (HCO3(-)) transporter
VAKSGKKKNNNKKNAAKRDGGSKRAHGGSSKNGAKGDSGVGFIPDRADMTIAQKIAWYSILAMVFTVPVAMSNTTWLPGFDAPLSFDQFDIIKVVLQRGFTLIAFAAWSWHILVEGGRIRRTKVDYVILALLGWILLTTFTSIHPPTAVFGKYRRFEGLLSFINYAAIFWLVTQFVDRASRVRLLAKTLFWSSVIVAFYGILQYVGFDPVPWGNLPFEPNRSFSTYGNPDLLGGFLVFALAISITLALSEKVPLWRGIYWAGFFLTAIVWITAFTRGAWIGGFVALAVIIFAMIRFRAKLNNVDYGALGAVGAALAFVIYRSLSAEYAVMNFARRFTSIVDFNDASARTRFQIWESALGAIADSPIVGHGADTFRLLFPKYKPVEYVEAAGYLSVADNVHNYPLQIASALGIPGALLLYGLFVAVAIISAPVVFAKKAGQERLLMVGFWAACAGYLAGLTFGISVTGVTFLLWVSMAVVLSPTAKTTPVRAPKWGMVAAAAILVLVAALLVGNTVYFRADYHYLRARVVDQGQARIDSALRAIELNPYNDMYRAELGVAYQDAAIQLYSQASQAEQSGQDAGPLLEQSRAMFLLGEEAINEAIEFVPAEYDNYVFLANLYNFAGEAYGDTAYFEEAVIIGEQGIEVEEFGPAIRIQTARALVNLGREDEAIEHLEFAVEMDPKYEDAWVILGGVYRRLDMNEEALEAYMKVNELNPGMAEIEEQIQAIEALLGLEAVQE